MSSTLPRLLLTGASGAIGRALRKGLADRFEITGWAHSAAGEKLKQVDLRDARALSAAFEEASPDFVVHTAAVSAPDEAERDPEMTRSLNVAATALLAGLCRARGARMIHFSTDLVFDGKRGDYRETDAPCPLNVYGKSKLDSERELLGACPNAVALRVALVYGWARGGRPTVLDDLNAKLSRRIAVKGFTDQIRTPTPMSGIVHAVRELLPRPDVTGILHCTGLDSVSRAEFARSFCRVFGYPEKLVIPCSMADVPLPAPRPVDSSLACERMAALLGLRLPGIEESLMRLKLAADAISAGGSGS